MFTRLLVPLDGSSLAESVLPLVERLAPACAATVVLLHVIERGAPSSVHGQRHLTAPGEAAAYLEGVRARLVRSHIAVELHTHEVPEGDVAASIAGHAGEERADLIVLCTHGRSTVRELLFGSIAQQVLRRGVTPVALIKPAPDAAAYRLRQVLVGLDGTAAAELALGPAQHLARALAAELCLVMVVPTQGTVRGERAAAATLLPATARAELELECEDAARYLEHLAADANQADLNINTRVSRGDIATALASAGDRGDTLVVVASHGRAGLQAIWAGSVSAQLLARSRGPVLLLRNVDE